VITAVHALIYARDADQVRAFLRDVLGFEFVEAHRGWPIFALPPAELGVHPADGPRYELSLMCEDLTGTMGELRARGVTFRGDPTEQSWGRGVTMVLPGAVELLLYEPRHPIAHAP